MKSLNKPLIFRKNGTLVKKITVLTLVLTVNLSAHIKFLFILVHKKQSLFEIMYIYLAFFFIFLSPEYFLHFVFFGSLWQTSYFFFHIIIDLHSHGVCDCDIWLALINHVLVITRFYWPFHSSIITSNLWCKLINWKLRISDHILGYQVWLDFSD